MNIVFACTHNSCRSQIAEFLAKKFNKNKELKFYSFGTDLSKPLNKNAIQYIKELYDEDISSFSPKLINEIPKPDILISMGCNVACPYGYKEYDYHFNLVDPSDFNEQDFKKVILEIETKVLQLLQQLTNNK